MTWRRDGRKVNVYEASQKPFQAEAWQSDRERRMSEPHVKKAQKGADRFTKFTCRRKVLAACSCGSVIDRAN